MEVVAVAPAAAANAAAVELEAREGAIAMAMARGIEMARALVDVATEQVRADKSR